MDICLPIGVDKFNIVRRYFTFHENEEKYQYKLLRGRIYTQAEKLLHSRHGIPFKMTTPLDSMERLSYFIYLKEA